LHKKYIEIIFGAYLIIDLAFTCKHNSFIGIIRKITLVDKYTKSGLQEYLNRQATCFHITLLKKQKSEQKSPRMPIINRLFLRDSGLLFTMSILATILKTKLEPDIFI
jgi:hypothetical protein